MKRSLFAMAALAASLLLPAVAQAANAYATGNVNMRAGPGTAYPRITTVQAGSPIDVYGCVAGWSWCDVGWRGVRGWVSGNYIEMMYRQRRVELPRYAPQIGVPIISFGIQSYWDRWYVDRPFYRERHHWYRRPHWDRPPPHWNDRPTRPPVYYDDVRPGRPNPRGDDLRRPGFPDRGEWRDDRRRGEWRDDRRRDDRRGEWRDDRRGGDDARRPGFRDPNYRGEERRRDDDPCARPLQGLGSPDWRCR